MKAMHFFWEICDQRSADPADLPRCCAGYRVNQGVGPGLLQQPLATIDNQNQSVQVLMSRSLPEFLSYMDKTLQVPPTPPDTARDQALKDMIQARNRLDQIMAENGLYKITLLSG